MIFEILTMRILIYIIAKLSPIKSLKIIQKINYLRNSKSFNKDMISKELSIILFFKILRVKN